jgi:hypothetical protein
VRILDAKWDDSRQFAFQFFRERFTEREYTPEILISICDSVREDVQQFGRDLITRYFRDEDGPEYLLKLSEHPTAALQLFVTNYLARYAADNPGRLRELQPYFTAVLCRVNRGRVAKDRVFEFLRGEARKDEQAARVVAEIFARQSATAAIGDRATTISALAEIKRTHPQVSVPIEIVAVALRERV